MNKLALTLAVTLVAAPFALADHGQLADSWNINYAFNPMGFTFFQTVDWVGVGGPGGGQRSLTGTGQLEAELTATPDDCLDQDHRGQFAYGNYHFAFPTIAQRVLHQDEDQVVPGQSVPAPAPLIDLCDSVRGVLFGQESDHEYGNDPQQIGFGDVTSSATTFVLPIGFFDESLVAEPLTLEARLCELATPATFSSTGNEVWAAFGFPNGKVTSTATNCLDITDGFLDNDELQAGGTWNAGSINDAGFSVYDLDLNDVFGDGTTAVAFGLHALCMRASVVDGNNQVAGFYEDYSYFWVDGPNNNYGLATSWADIRTTDGGATGQDCSSIDILLP